MFTFDVIVIGSGAGYNVTMNLLQEGRRVALVDKGPLGGTCLNNGCIPSKVLITPADVIQLPGREGHRRRGQRDEGRFSLYTGPLPEAPGRRA